MGKMNVGKPANPPGLDMGGGTKTDHGRSAFSSGPKFDLTPRDIQWHTNMTDSAITSTPYGPPYGGINQAKTDSKE